MMMHDLNQFHEVVSQDQQLESGLQLFTASSPELHCYVFIPENLTASNRVLVCVHGVSRNALELIRLLRPFAERYGYALIAPLFAPKTFRDYQRLGRRGHGPRADLALIRVLQTIGAATSLTTNKVAMFGFSGGAQFVHRFAFAHGQRVASMVLGAAGWYTMPDTQKSYPYGTADAKGLDAVRFNVRAATRLPTLVVVGSEDADANDPELNGSVRVVREQGPHRLARARSWVEAMKTSASRHDSPADIQLRLLPGVGHSFADAVIGGGLGEVMFVFLDRSVVDGASGSVLPLTQESLVPQESNDSRLSE